MNNNQRDQRALLAHCKGVFDVAGWINHGSKDDPLPYVSKGPERDSYRGKQFGIAATKSGKTPSSYFDPQHKYLAEGQEFVDRWKYAELQPEKPGKGFGTSDYCKRDEFALNIRTQQHRQQLRHEAAQAQAAAARLAARGGGAAGKESAGGGAAAAAAAGGMKKAAPLLFDLVFNRQTEFCTKVKHDTLNPTALSRDRNWGAYKTMSALAHAPPTAPAKTPQFVHRPAIKEEFYRRTNIFFPRGCAAESQGQ